jgi:hypothetical protein
MTTLPCGPDGLLAAAEIERSFVQGLRRAPLRGAPALRKLVNLVWQSFIGGE